MTLALFGAMAGEVKPLLRRLKIIREIREKETHIFETRWRERPLYVVRTGVGKKNAERAARRLLAIATPRLGISFGLCGAVDPALRVGDTLICAHVVDLLTKQRFESFVGARHAVPLQGLLVTSDHVLGRGEKEKLLREIPDAKVCDMESSALAKVFSEKNIPLVVLRTVSDRWDVEFPPAEILIQTNLWRQLKMLFLHYQHRFPVEFFRLLKLGWHCRHAAKKNAREVLKFLSFFVDTILWKS